MKVEFKYLSSEPDRYGNERLYVRRYGRRIRLHSKPVDAIFASEYAAALAALQGPQGRAPVTAAVTAPHPVGTLGWLGAQYFASRGEGEFLTLDKDSQRRRRNDLEACFAYPLSDTNKEPMGNCPLKHLTAQKLKRLIEAKDGPGARAGRRKNLSTLCSWAVDNHHLPSNPVRDLKAGRRVKGGGFYTWTVPDVQQYLAFHSGEDRRSKKARLALGLLLFGGMRRQDMVSVGKQHCRGATPNQLGDWIRYTPKKTLWRRRNISQKPLLPVLKAIILDCWDIVGDMTFLVTDYGKPFTENGIGNWFRDRCDDAGLKQCTAHGLKKAGATIAAENGATTRQLMAMFDWDSPAMAEVYTRTAEQKRLAGDAMFLISLEKAS